VRKQKKRSRKRTSQTFQGSAWVMPSAAVAKATYHTVLNRLLPRNPENWSLVSGFFQRKPVIAFLWTLELPPRLVATVQRTILTAGGEKLDEETTTMLVTQVFARRRALQAKEPFETLVAHHPKGKPFWDLED
jgi:hypothetical protein